MHKSHKSNSKATRDIRKENKHRYGKSRTKINQNTTMLKLSNMHILQGVLSRTGTGSRIPTSPELVTSPPPSYMEISSA
eukprot:15359478-Ditylum_brightwellii.AAC.1